MRGEATWLNGSWVNARSSALGPKPVSDPEAPSESELLLSRLMALAQRCRIEICAGSSLSLPRAEDQAEPQLRQNKLNGEHVASPSAALSCSLHAALCTMHALGRIDKFVAPRLPNDTAIRLCRAPERSSHSRFDRGIAPLAPDPRSAQVSLGLRTSIVGVRRMSRGIFA